MLKDQNFHAPVIHGDLIVNVEVKIGEKPIENLGNQLGPMLMPVFMEMLFRNKRTGTPPMKEENANPIPEEKEEKQENVNQKEESANHFAPHTKARK